MLLGLIAGVALTHGNEEPSPVPQGGWVGHSDIEWAMNGNEWSPKIAQQFPGCHRLVEGTLSETVVVIWESGTVSAIPTDQAFALVERPGAYAFWTVGQCDAEAVAA